MEIEKSFYLLYRYGWIIKMVASAAANGGEAFDDKVGADFEFEVNEDKEVKVIMNCASV